MYHEVTYVELRKRRNHRIRLVVIAVLVAVAIWQAAAAGKALARAQGAATMRDAVMRSALQCCAVEGSFPTTLRHLEEHYGLVVNGQGYRVSYEWMGDNVPPAVVVTPL